MGGRQRPTVKYHYSRSSFTYSVERSEAATLPSSAKVAAVGEAGLVGSSAQRRHARTSAVRSDPSVECERTGRRTDTDFPP